MRIFWGCLVIFWGIGTAQAQRTSVWQSLHTEAEQYVHAWGDWAEARWAYIWAQARLQESRIATRQARAAQEAARRALEAARLAELARPPRNKDPEIHHVLALLTTAPMREEPYHLREQLACVCAGYAIYIAQGRPRRFDSILRNSIAQFLRIVHAQGLTPHSPMLYNPDEDPERASLASLRFADPEVQVLRTLCQTLRPELPLDCWREILAGLPFQDTRIEGDQIVVLTALGFRRLAALAAWEELP